MYTKNTFWIR